MSLQGDLSTLDFAGLFQNLEAARKSGLLTVQVAGQGETKLYFHHGKLALIAYSGRPRLEEILVASGTVSAREVEAAKRRKRGGKRSLVEVLADGKAASAEQLATIAAARITSEACELINAGGGAFVFTEGPIPRGVFDPEERALGITLPAGPLLLESARRSDHWRLIRERVPSDSTHYVLARTPRTPSDASQAKVLEQMTPLLDGSRSVAEIVGAFPHRRFEAYQVLADLAETQAIRLSTPAETNKLIQELSRHDRERALELLERGLAANPRNLNLLCTKALIAEELGELEQASEALKVAVHLQLEAGSAGDARKGLERLKELGPEDPFVWERSFELAVQEGRMEDALEDGGQLVELYKGPGLFKKAAGVLERMVELSGGAWEHVRSLAHARADAGEREEAVKGLEDFGAEQLGQENYAFAHKVYLEILSIDPECESAKETIAEIKSGELARKKALWRRVKSRAVLGLCAAVALFGLSYEILARRAYVAAQLDVTQRGLIEGGYYAQALELYAQMQARYPWATVSLYDARRQIAELEAKIAAAAGPRHGP
jgi:tetratricopeptide (TPR) repeat protein